MHRQFKKTSQNKQYVEYLGNDLNNIFQFACQKWINQLN